MKTLEKRKVLTDLSKDWKEFSKISRDPIREGRELAKSLGDKFNGVNFTELQARKVIHGIGLPTFPVPKGMNVEDFHIRISDIGGGMRYLHKGKKQVEVRVMPGNPNSRHLSQREPYAVHHSPKGYLDKNGKVVKRKSPESHISLEDYNFEDLIKIGDKID